MSDPTVSQSSLGGERSPEATFAESIIDTMRDPLLVLNGDLHVVLASREFYRTFGVTREETEGRLVYELGNRQWDIPRLRTLLEEILPTQTTFRDFEVEHVFETIGRKVMLLNARRLRQVSGDDEKILLVIEDATDRHDVEEARREAETRFTEMVRNVRDHSIFLTDPEGVITSWNVAAERVIGYSGAEAVGQHFSLIFTPEDLQSGLPQSELRTAREEGRAEDERWHVRKGGERFWALGIVTPLREADGRLTGYSKILRDMTDRKRAAEALRESEERLRVALSVADMGTWLWRIGADEQVIDDSLSRLMGLQAGEKVMPLAAFLRAVHAEDRELVRAEFERCLRDGGEFTVEFRVTRPDGSVHWLRDRGKAFPADGPPLFLTGAAVDITERKRVEEVLRDADRRKDDFLALLAHELRNPLAPIRNGLQVIRLSEVREIREKSQAMMDRQLTHMVRLIDDLLDVSRINRNKMELRRSRILLADALSSAVETARPMIEAAGHELATGIPIDPISLDADLTRLAQVFANLLTNSAKYTEPGGRISLAARRDGDEAVVTVTDTGIGIPAESLPRIFDMFSQVDRSIERTTGGLGIGLALVKGLVDMHGGTVVAASSGEGMGSEFTVRLPAVPIRSERLADAPPVHNVAESGPGRRILVVDDNRDSAESMGEMLRLFGHQVTIAQDGVEAVERAGEFRPDVILMDVGMPRMNGYEATRRIREHPWGRGMAIIALTGWGQDADRTRSSEAGCDGHLVKPVSLTDLTKLLSGLK